MQGSATHATARLSTLLGALLPAPAVLVCCTEPADPASLSPGERADVARAAPVRLREFAAGRQCARRALVHFGLIDVELRVGADRRPQWPAGFTGSITHTEGFYAAAVAPRSALPGIGIDCERIGRIGPRLLPRIATAAEIDWLESLDDAQQARAASLLFSAKEAFYKAQFALVGERPGFHDVRIEVSAWRRTGGEFTVRTLRPLAIDAHSAAPLIGRFRFHGAFVSAGIGCAAGQNVMISS